jgi:hypothetical protein
MMAALSDPEGYRILSAEDTGPQYARVLVEFTDRVMDQQGQTQQVPKRFLFEVRVDSNGALVIGVYFPPAN